DLSILGGVNVELSRGESVALLGASEFERSSGVDSPRTSPAWLRPQQRGCGLKSRSGVNSKEAWCRL
ncbi:MAG: hypothetical protein AAFX94_07155, partial [Myxococcota bacterium]